LVFLKSFDEIFFTNFKNFYWWDFDGEKVVCKFQQSSNLFIVWPEWGFSKKEIETLQKKWKGINLWNFILRAETAAIVWAWLV
jgi:16S rRNA U1498 N3-methylase RsmE